MAKVRLGVNAAGLFVLLALTFSNTATAGIINACDYEAGTDLSHIAKGATVSMVSADYPNPEQQDQVPAIVGEPYYDSPYTSCNRSIGDTTENTLDIWVREVYDDSGSRYSSLRVDFVPPVRSISFTGSSFTGDSVLALLFGLDNQLLSQAPSGYTFFQTQIGDCFDSRGEPVICHRFTGHIEIPEGMPVSYMFLGSAEQVSAAWIESISFSVPEPKTLALFGLGLIGMSFTRRRKAA